LALKVVQKYAGHSSLAVTMDWCMHVFKSADHHIAMDQVTMNLFESDGREAGAHPKMKDRTMGLDFQNAL
jgi:hypothetical protein